MFYFIFEFFNYLSNVVDSVKYFEKKNEKIYLFIQENQIANAEVSYGVLRGEWVSLKVVTICSNI